MPAHRLTVTSHKIRLNPAPAPQSRQTRNQTVNFKAGSIYFKVQSAVGG